MSVHPDGRLGVSPEKVNWPIRLLFPSIQKQAVTLCKRIAFGTDGEKLLRDAAEDWIGFVETSDHELSDRDRARYLLALDIRDSLAV